MRVLEQQMIRWRSAWRKGVSRLGLTSPERIRPARLVLRLDDRDLPGSLGEGTALSLSDWSHWLVSAVGWLGPVPITILATESATRPLTLELLRFVYRLDCPIRLVTSGSGIDDEHAQLMLHHGVHEVQVLVAGLSDAIQQRVVGNAASEATEAVRALVAARQRLQASASIEVLIPWQGSADLEARAIIGWARQIGADGFRVLAPWQARDLVVHPELLDELANEPGPFNRTPMATIHELHSMACHQDGEPGLSRDNVPSRRFLHRCPVAGQRLVLTSHGRVYSCPFKSPISQSAERLPDLWGKGQQHFDEIRSCGRACAHIELAPTPVLAGR